VCCRSPLTARSTLPRGRRTDASPARPPTGAPVEWVEEPSYFFRLSDWQEPLLRFYDKHPDFILPASHRNEVIRFVEGGLQDLSVSRTSFRWGIPVADDPLAAVREAAGELHAATVEEVREDIEAEAKDEAEKAGGNR
jgi:hypothetical protein